MNGYQGIQLPSWMRNTLVLKDLVEVILDDCVNCKQLPPLGKLPHLQNSNCIWNDKVKHIDGESYDDVEKLPNLERILRDEGVEMIPCLSELTIVGIPNLKLPSLSSVEYLYSRDIEDAASFMD